MPTTVRKSIELASLISCGELGYHAGYKLLDSALEEGVKPSSRNINRYVFPVLATGALVLATKIPVTASGKLFFAVGSISEIVYPAVKNYGLEGQQLPQNKYREIADGAAAGAAAGALDCAWRRIHPPLMPIRGIPPKFLPHTLGGCLAGAGIVLGSLLVDTLTKK